MIAVKNKKVLELGSGCGLVGLVIASLGARVALTDLPKTMGLLERNIELNAEVIQRGSGSVTAFPLVWGETDCSKLHDHWQTADIIVAADVIYDRDLMSPLLETAKALTVKPGAVFLLSHVRRWKHDKLFFAAAKKAFKVLDVYQDNAGSDKGREEASHTRGALRLYQLTRHQ